LTGEAKVDTNVATTKTEFWEKEIDEKHRTYPPNWRAYNDYNSNNSDILFTNLREYSSTLKRKNILKLKSASWRISIVLICLDLLKTAR